MPATFNDGAIPYGSRILAITNNTPDADPVNFVAENITPNRPTKIIERSGALDQPTGQVGIATFMTGSATLQLESDATVPPNLGATFSTTWNPVDGEEDFIISEVGQPESQGDAKKVTITFRKVYGS